MSHFTIGGGFPDPRAKDPLTAMPLCLSDDCQSRKNCFPFMINFAPESKAAFYDNVLPFYQFLEDVTIPAIGGLPELSNFKVVSTSE